MTKVFERDGLRKQVALFVGAECQKKATLNLELDVSILTDRGDSEGSILDRFPIVTASSYVTGHLDSGTLHLQKTEISEFTDELYDLADAWIKSDEKGSIIIPQSLLEKHGLNGLDNFLENYLNGFLVNRLVWLRYKGFVFNVIKNLEGEVPTYYLEKKFTAKYSVLISNKLNKPQITFTAINPSDEHKFCSRTKKTKKTVTRYWLYANTITIDIKNYFEFLESNGIEDFDLLAEEGSIDMFYGFDDVWFIKPTPAIVARWWDYDCPALYKHSVNKKGETNGWGMIPCWWENPLITACWKDIFVASDISETEAKVFTKGREDTEIYAQVQRVLKVKTITPEDKKTLEAEVLAFEETVRGAIETHRHDILLKTAKEMNLAVHGDMTDETLHAMITKNEPQGFNCGFAYLSPTGARLNKFKMLSLLDDSRFKDGSIKELNLPWEGQSVDVKKIELRVISNILKDEYGVEVIGWTVLD